MSKKTSKKNLFKYYMQAADYCPLPKEFHNWIDNTVFYDCIYLFFHKKSDKRNSGYIGLCSHCNNTVELAKATSGKYIICPSCGTRVRLRNEIFSNVITDKRRVSYVQELCNYSEEMLGDRILVRFFYSHKTTNFDPATNRIDIEFDLYEVQRDVFNLTTHSKEQQYHATSDWNNGIMDRKWIHGCYPRMYGGDIALEDRIYTYPKNLNKALTSNYDEYHNTAAEEYFQKETYSCFYHYFIAYTYYPIIESYVKIGLTNIANRIISKANGWNNSVLGDISLHEKEIYKSIGISNKGDFKFIVENNLSVEELEVFKELNLLKDKNRYNCSFIKQLVKTDIFTAQRKDLIISRMSLQSFINYAEKNKRDKTFFALRHFTRDYLDYLEYCEFLQYDLKNTAFLKPKDFEAMHDRIIDEYNVVKEKANTEKFKKVISKYTNLLQYSDKKLCVIIADSPAALEKESKVLQHCVRSYADRIIKEQSLILFIREIGKIRKPYFTLELNPKTFDIVQCRGKSNCSAPSPVTQFITQWKDAVLEPVKQLSDLRMHQIQAQTVV